MAERTADEWRALALADARSKLRGLAHLSDDEILDHMRKFHDELSAYLAEAVAEEEAEWEAEAIDSAGDSTPASAPPLPDGENRK